MHHKEHKSGHHSKDHHTSHHVEHHSGHHGHHHHKGGGDVHIPHANEEKPVEKEARKKYKRGGKTVHPMTGEDDMHMAHGGHSHHQKHHAHGGHAHKGKKKHIHEASGGAPHHRMDRPARKSGGKVGADQHPFSSAAKITAPATAYK